MSTIAGISVVPFFVYFLVILFVFLIAFRRSFALAHLAVSKKPITAIFVFIEFRIWFFCITGGAYFNSLFGKFNFPSVNIATSALNTIAHANEVCHVWSIKFLVSKCTITLWAIFEAKFFCIKSFFVGASTTFANWCNAIISSFVFVKSRFNWFFLLAFGAIFEDTIHRQISLLDLAVSRLFAATRDFSCQLPLNYNTK